MDVDPDLTQSLPTEFTIIITAEPSSSSTIITIEKEKEEKSQNDEMDHSLIPQSHIPPSLPTLLNEEKSNSPTLPTQIMDPIGEEIRDTLPTQIISFDQEEELDDKKNQITIDQTVVFTQTVPYEENNTNENENENGNGNGNGNVNKVIKKSNNSTSKNSLFYKFIEKLGLQQ